MATIGTGCVSVFFAAVVLRAKIQSTQAVQGHRDSIISMDDIALYSSLTSTDSNADADSSGGCTGGSDCNQAFFSENDIGGDFLPSDKILAKNKDDDDEDMPMN